LDEFCSRDFRQKNKKIISDISIVYEGFDIYMEAKIKQNEAYMAVNEASQECAGIIAFSKKHNRIIFWGSFQGIQI
jgi:hypothetical protein